MTKNSLNSFKNKKAYSIGDIRSFFIFMAKRPQNSKKSKKYSRMKIYVIEKVKLPTGLVN
jgi:hypothetical protein